MKGAGRQPCHAAAWRKKCGVAGTHIAGPATPRESPPRAGRGKVGDPDRGHRPPRPCSPRALTNYRPDNSAAIWLELIRPVGTRTKSCAAAEGERRPPRRCTRRRSPREHWRQGNTPPTNADLLRCGRPQRAGHFGLRAHIDVSSAPNTATKLNSVWGTSGGPTRAGSLTSGAGGQHGTMSLSLRSGLSCPYAPLAWPGVRIRPLNRQFAGRAWDPRPGATSVPRDRTPSHQEA
jgi:hypothetical protein